MKSKLLIALLILGMSGIAMAQEDDNMYFNKNDRTGISRKTEKAIRSITVNPSFSYSGRGINPEYTSQSLNRVSAAQKEKAYFLPPIPPSDGAHLSPRLLQLLSDLSPRIQLCLNIDGFVLPIAPRGLLD